MRVLTVIALTLALGACQAPALVKSAPEPSPYGIPCARECTVRVVNQTPHQLSVLASTPDGTKRIGSVAPGKEGTFGQSILAPSYVVTPDAGSSPTAGNAQLTCTNGNPRPGEDVLMTCK